MTEETNTEGRSPPIYNQSYCPALALGRSTAFGRDFFEEPQQVLGSRYWKNIVVWTERFKDDY